MRIWRREPGPELWNGLLQVNSADSRDQYPDQGQSPVLANGDLHIPGNEPNLACSGENGWDLRAIVSVANWRDNALALMLRERGR